MTEFDLEDEPLGSEATGGFSDKYEVKEKLGAGISSVVRRCIHKITGKPYAVKIIDKLSDAGGVDIEATTWDEVSVLLALQGHENIIGLVDVFESPVFFFLVFELAVKGELFDHLTNQVTLSEKKTRRIMHEVFEAVKFMHDQDIVHRDLKPENILLDEDYRVKISDFGFAVKLKEGEKLRELCGTPGYLSPEALQCSMFGDAPGYSKEVDVWACGVIMYTLLVGCPPFWHRRQVTMLRSIMEGRYHFHSPEWDDISESAKDLISKLLVVHPKGRLSAEQALEHAWFKGAQQAKNDGFSAKWKFKGTVIALIAVREFSKFAKNKLQPVTFDSILREPYGVKPLRKMIDGCAFRIYGHWVKRNKDENQNRAALFENKPHKERYNGNGDGPRKKSNLDSYNASFRMSSVGLIQYKSIRKLTPSN
ncbi:phosphorylase b kinase gamma catalytic chain, skeletal muscle/heart isoform-like isoform X2 [Stylophora pistillata]|uniref:phosphorylase kinase n=1 Tax=Stylophora pistillata TaxID=50429 RepID=A0A2B4SUQ4_STYPI|nr:phosphorylase b kinase gamma catalytic chain, skeletal muscle/heart isoform-like isoform X2 [Stylophora pistillata]PFX32889.1 Phosphorylase b kinase gamma catalytic chain, liver/testis isoform [Stylophora pistillata]